MRLRALLFALVAGLAVFATASAAGAAEENYKGHAEEECAHILAEGKAIDACQEAPNPILPATNELIWGALAFLVLFGLTAKFAYPAIKGAMDARTEKISNSLDEAENAKVEAETVLAEYKAQLADARAESSRIIEEARAQAEQVRHDLTARAEAEAAEARQRNAAQIASERDRVLSDLQGQVAAIAIELAEKVVESNLDREANTRLIESYIDSVGTSR